MNQNTNTAPTARRHFPCASGGRPICAMGPGHCAQSCCLAGEPKPAAAPAEAACSDLHQHLAQCLAACGEPPDGHTLRAAWLEAQESPEAIPDYVRAAVRDLRGQCETLASMVAARAAQPASGAQITDAMVTAAMHGYQTEYDEQAYRWRKQGSEPDRRAIFEASIRAALAAAPVTDPGAAGDAEFLSLRLIRLAKALGYTMPAGPHEFIAGIAGTILGGMAGLVECSQKAAAPAAAQAPRQPLTDAQIEAGREEVFDVNNPFCPCTSKTMRKAVRWAECAHGIGAAAPAGEQQPKPRACTYPECEGSETVCECFSAPAGTTEGVA